MRRHRNHFIVRGAREETALEAEALVGERLKGAVLWVGADQPAALHWVVTSAKKTGALLGQSFDLVVLDLHGGLEAEALGRCHGFIWGGGVLVLRMPPEGELPMEQQPRLAAHPHTPEEVGHRFWTRFERCLSRSLAAIDVLPPPERVARAVRGSDEQAKVVRALSAAFESEQPQTLALLSDRGRGKSAALGLALRETCARRIDQGARPLRVAITAGHERSTAEVFRFLDSVASARFVPIATLLRETAQYDLLLVDEAAQIPIPILRRLVAVHSQATLAFATTSRGYEGTGRGFVLRFLEELKKGPRPFSLHTLHAPIRYGADDPLERFVFDALALDAAPAKHSGVLPGGIGEIEHKVLEPDVLSQNEPLLREFFGLLVHAHYRTTPSDLHRALDAPNLRLHALMHGKQVVAASLIALEGTLPKPLSERVFAGNTRLVGHALAENLISHSGRKDAGSLSMVRSVRIAVHPSLRRLGLASVLVDAVHKTYTPDLFGTLFGATEELLRFRKSVGYTLIRMGASRGARTGEPAAVMIRPCSEAGRALLRDLRQDLARDLPLQLQLSLADGHPDPGQALIQALSADLPQTTPLSANDARSLCISYVSGPRTYESAASALSILVDAHLEELRALEESNKLNPSHRKLIEARVARRLGWAEAAALAGYPSVPAAMRAMRRAISELLDATSSE